MLFTHYYIVANIREEFDNMSSVSQQAYNDHPSRTSIETIVHELSQIGYPVSYFGGVDALINAYHNKHKFQNALFLNFSDGLHHKSRKAQTSILLELLEVHYAGSEALSQLIAGNKIYAKTLLPKDILTPISYLVHQVKHITDTLTFPVVVKPNREGSSLGITQESLCFSIDKIHARVATLLKEFDEIIVEEYVEGYEVTCFIIGNIGHYYLVEAILSEYEGELYHKKFLFGIEEKASRRRKQYLASEFLSMSEIDLIKKTTCTIFEALEMYDYARVDFRLKKDGSLFFIEINGNPAISKTSEIGLISEKFNMSFGKIVEYVVHTATERINRVYM